MRQVVLVLGIFLALAGALGGWGALERERGKSLEIRRVMAAIEGLRQKKLSLEKLPQEAPAPLMGIYAAMVNDMNMLAAAHHVLCTVSVKGSDDADVQKSAVDSDIQGVRELRLHVVFSGLTRRPAIVSLLDAAVAVGRALPVVMHSARYERDILAFEFSVLGF